ncbi:MAG: D-aminoacylase [Defluviitaleaceae bacterium]|nr:D-aminoacylase [Defluviitaleaceae bacterium]MCL2836871.1 D-aminoacylase [Defluviitaleaceae bacterium]
MYDIIVKNGFIADGTGKPGFTGDIAVKNGIIAEIGRVDGEAAEVFDASGLVVSPGFIDAHTHSDKSALFGSGAYNYLEQGVTLQAAGQCGSSPAPFGGREALISDLELSPEDAELAAKFCETPESFMRRASEVNHGTNLAFFIGHGAVRNKVMGYDNSKPSAKAMDEMKDLIKRAMDSGYLGYSSGLTYAPSAYAGIDELIELAKVMAPYGGVYTSHVRCEASTGVESVADAIRIGEEAGVPVLISHLKVVGKRNEGNSARYFELIEAAVARGVRVFADQYPFTASSAPLSAQIPPKYHVGGTQAMLDRIADKKIRKEILDTILTKTNEFESSITTAGFGGILVVGSPKKPEYVGKTIAQIAEEAGKEPFDALCGLLLENGGSGGGIYFSQNESDMLRIIAHPRVVGGSDWSDINEEQDPERVAGCHPRGIATFPRRLELLRDKNLLSLEEAVMSITSRTAEALGISGHGILAKGLSANITIFDHARIKASADFIHPFRRNEGIRAVIVNGGIAVRDGKATGIRAGKAVRRTHG